MFAWVKRPENPAHKSVQDVGAPGQNTTWQAGQCVGVEAGQGVYPKHEGGHVWINKHQYFADVPQTAWSFYIGGYQPAQKWLKDRKGRTLTYADLQHYQNIIKILLETDRIMKKIILPLDLLAD
jgi:hypothetical protein